MKIVKAILATALLAVGFSTSVALAEYPERPVQFVVPWPPGDLEDTVTRMIVEEFQKETGVPTSTLNIKGGGGLIGATQVFTAPADGYTIGVFTGNIVTAHIIRGNAKYDRAEFEPLGIIIEYPQMLVTRGDSPYKNIAELADHAKTNSVSLGVTGLNNPPTLQTLKMAEILGFVFGSVTAYDESNCLLLASGEIDVLLGGSLLKPCMTSGEAKGLGAFTRTRIRIYPDVATLDEQVPGIATPGWTGIFVRKDTPSDVRELISTIAKRVVETDKAQEIADNVGGSIGWLPADESEVFIEDYFNRFKSLLGQ